MQSLHLTVLPTYLAWTHAYRVECTVYGVKSFSLRLSLCPWYVRTNSLHLHSESWFSHTHTLRNFISDTLMYKTILYCGSLFTYFVFSCCCFFFWKTAISSNFKFFDNNQHGHWAPTCRILDFKTDGILNWKIRHASKFEVSMKEIEM